MHFGSKTATTGRYVVDIDGCLRTTDTLQLTARDVIALRGGAETGVVSWEINGESVPLSGGDRVELDEHSVAFFRICEGPAFYRAACYDARFGAVRVPIAYPGQGAIAA